MSGVYNDERAKPPRSAVGTKRRSPSKGGNGNELAPPALTGLELAGTADYDAFLIESHRLRRQKKRLAPLANIHVPSSFGKQFTSTIHSAASWGFGSSSPTNNRPSKSPGPGAYRTGSGLGTMPLSVHRSAPKPSIAGREKFGEMLNFKEASTTPGPGQYKVPNMAKTFKWSFGEKLDKDFVKDSPGPGQYKTVSGIGKQQLSAKLSQTGPVFGTGTRGDMVNYTHSKNAGPGAYSVPTAITRKGTRFGKSHQRPRLSKSASAPGPAAYRIGGSMGRQLSSIHKSSPGASMSGRVKFGSAF